MRAGVVLAAAAVLAAPASARAAALGELPVQPLSSPGACLAATGAPGELVRSSPAGAHFMQLSASGLADGPTVVTGVANGQCPQAAAQPGGAGVVVQAGAGLWAATRDPGAGWGTPVKLAGDALVAADAVAPSGAAVVAWVAHGGANGYAVQVARRDAGGAFGPPATLVTFTDRFERFALQAGIDGAGGVVVAWTQPGADSSTLAAAAAPPGGAFGPVQQVARIAAGAFPSLAEAPDGRALLAFWDGKAVAVAERAPGQPFAAPTAVAPSAGAVTVSAALGAVGAAVAYGDVVSDSVHVVTRAGAGAFGSPVAVAAAPPRDALGRLTALLFTAIPYPFDPEFSLFYSGNPTSLRTAITPGGSALLAWTSRSGTEEARYATVPLAGGHVDRGPLGANLREPNAATPVVMPDGRAAFAWSDSGKPGPRLHTAVEGVAPPTAPAAPVVTFGFPVDTVLSAAEPLKLPVHCSAACDIALSLDGAVYASAHLSLRAAGDGMVVLQSGLAALAPPRRGPVRLNVRSGAPDALSATRRVLTVTLAQARHKPGPSVRGATAVRDGDDVVVRWTSTRTADRDSFLVLGTTARELAGAVVFPRSASGSHGHFSARFKKPAGVRYVTVVAGDDYGITGEQEVAVK